jgi:hypothetical protein
MLSVHRSACGEVSLARHSKQPSAAEPHTFLPMSDSATKEEVHLLLAALLATRKPPAKFSHPAVLKLTFSHSRIRCSHAQWIDAYEFPKCPKETAACRTSGDGSKLRNLATHVTLDLICCL